MKYYLASNIYESFLTYLGNKCRTLSVPGATVSLLAYESHWTGELGMVTCDQGMVLANGQRSDYTICNTSGMWSREHECKGKY